MLVRMQKYFSTIPPVFLDGALYTAVAILVFWQIIFGSDEAAKYISPLWLFLIKLGVGTGAVGANAVKSYRSTSFAEHQQAKRDLSDQQQEEIKIK